MLCNFGESKEKKNNALIKLERLALKQILLKIHDKYLPNTRLTVDIYKKQRGCFRKAFSKNWSLIRDEYCDIFFFNQSFIWQRSECNFDLCKNAFYDLLILIRGETSVVFISSLFGPPPNRGTLFWKLGPFLKKICTKYFFKKRKLYV